MNKIILVIVGVSFVAAISLAASYKSDLPNQGEVEITDSAQIQPTANDVVSITDTANTTKNNVEFTINDQGKKNYVITATDSPDVSD